MMFLSMFKHIKIIKQLNKEKNKKNDRIPRESSSKFHHLTNIT